MNINVIQFVWEEFADIALPFQPDLIVAAGIVRVEINVYRNIHIYIYT